MSQSQYPLEQITVIKQRKLETAEKILKEKKQALQTEQDKCAALEKERDAVKSHWDDKLQQLRDTLDQSSTSDKIQQMKVYMKEVDIKLKQKEGKVTEQQKRVAVAEQHVEEARKEMIKREQDVEKMRLHKKEWDKEMKILAEQKESMEMDETGSSIYSRQKIKNSRKIK
ncbi:MAG: type III secretion T3S chaperone [Chlamydiae bacterium]|nr:type III secretion T3S chaperone [Chlamydiota bacterium]